MSLHCCERINNSYKVVKQMKPKDENAYIELIEQSDIDFSDIEKLILFLKEKGASQMTSVKVLKVFKNMRLKEADNLIQNSIHWKEFKKSNESLRDAFFSKDDNNR